MLIYKNQTVDESRLKQIAAGGEGIIYEIGTKVLKVYHIPRPVKFESHLKNLTQLDNRFVKPIDVWYTQSGLVGGFTMDYVDLNKYWIFSNLFNKGFCIQNKIDKAFKIKVLNNLKDALEYAHSKEIVIGDVNQYNIFIKRDGSILFCDVDSFSTKSQPHSGVLLDEIRDWTVTSIDKNTDTWAYNILSFWSTTFVHPFKWVCKGNNETLEQRVRQSKSILSKIQGMITPACYEVPDPIVVPQYEEVFKGRRYFVDFNGVKTVSIVIPKQVTSTALNIIHLLDNISKVRCAGTQCAIQVNNKWIVLDTSFLGLVRQKQEVDCDDLFVSAKGYLYLKEGTLYSATNQLVKQFSNYQHYYYNGYLMIVDYGKDDQYNYNIDNQLAGVENTITPVFAKSILFNGCPIQNFGLKKFINIPMGSRYTLLEVSQGTKNAYYNQGWCVTEGVEKGKIKFTLFKPSPSKLETGVELDYLPHFAVKGDTLLLPDAGFINVVQNGTIITKLDCGCTRDSQLFSTTSGLLMLENQSLYLLNTK